MQCLDVNILIYAFREESPRHIEYQSWLDKARRGREIVAVPDIAASAMLRITTNARIFQQPSTILESVAFLDALFASPAIRRIRAGDAHWQHFIELCNEIDARANDVPDAFLGAYALENNATWVSADHGFARFKQLRWRHPLTRE